MKLRTLFCCTLMCSLALAASQGQSRPASTASASDIPHLRKQGTATQLIVDGKPFLALAGELRNNSATSLEYMKPVWPKLVEAKLNTVLAGVSWDQIEPQEGKFDFSVLDGVIRGARESQPASRASVVRNLEERSVQLPARLGEEGLRAVPARPDGRGSHPGPCSESRAPVTGSMSIELLSPFGDATRDADARAFAALMRHVKAVDGQQHTVIMIQVENEVGMQGDTRDRSPVANKAFEGPVPKELMDYLQQHKDTLIPEFRKVWEAAGFKTSGTWEEVFGKGRAADEIFMAWNFARYVGRVVEAGKAEYPIPMFTNCPQDGFGTGARAAPRRRTERRPHARRDGRLESRGAANRYVRGRHLQPRLRGVLREVHPIREPAVHTRDGRWAMDAARVALRLRTPRCDRLLAHGGRDGRLAPDTELISGYDLIAQLAPLICEAPGQRHDVRRPGWNPKDPPQKVQLGNYTLEVAFVRCACGAAAGTPASQPPGASALPGGDFHCDRA